MRQHIELYVNGFSLDLGETGRKAIIALYQIFNGQQPEPLSGKMFIS